MMTTRQKEFIKKHIYMNNILLENEALDDLQINNLYIIQKKTGFKFGTDAVLLSDFAKAVKAKKILDLCTGSGIVPLLLSAKTTAEEIHGLEVQEDIAEMAKRSVLLNGLDRRIFIRQGDLKEVKSYYTPHSFDTVTINPPYMKAAANMKNILNSKTIARHEVLCSIGDCAKACSEMLRFHGNLFMIHRPKRLIDITEALRHEKLEPKTIRFVHSKVGLEPSMVLIHAVYHGGSELKILPPLILQNEDGSETGELKKIYGGNR